MKALQKSADDRYSDAAMMQAALEDWLLLNKLPSSSVHVAAFMQEICAERLEREAAEGRVLVDELASRATPRSRYRGRPLRRRPGAAATSTGRTTALRPTPTPTRRAPSAATARRRSESHSARPP